MVEQVAVAALSAANACFYPLCSFPNLCPSGDDRDYENSLFERHLDLAHRPVARGLCECHGDRPHVNDHANRFGVVLESFYRNAHNSDHRVVVVAAAEAHCLHEVHFQEVEAGVLTVSVDIAVIQVVDYYIAESHEGSGEASVIRACKSRIALGEEIFSLHSGGLAHRCPAEDHGHDYSQDTEDCAEEKILNSLSFFYHAP